MSQLIERGHVYIAQPPLYKVKKGKQEQYLKDDTDLNQYLLRLALDNANFFVNDGAPAMSGSAVETLVKQFNEVSATINRLSRRYNQLFLEKLVHMPRVTNDLLQDHAAFGTWLEELSGRLNIDKDISNQYSLSRTEPTNEEEEPVAIVVSHWIHGISSETLFPITFFSSGEYRKLVELGSQLEGLLGQGAYVQRGERRQEISSFKQGLNWLMEEAKRGQHIQRYKGLGEMNPGQLWETTMNPEQRTLLQVTIADAVEADQVFSILMGDEVEPRRQFISENAMQVQNLDI